MTIHSLENKKKGKGKVKATLQVACLFACFAACVSLLADFRFPSLLLTLLFSEFLTWDSHLGII
jgi:hypothetical protein